MERLWTKSFIQMTFGMLFLFIAFYMLYPTLPLYLREMGGSESQIGLATGLFMLTAVVFRPFVGGLLDRFGRRPFIIWGLLLFALVLYMYNWVGGIAALIVLRLFHGATWAVSTTGYLTAVTDLIPKSRRGEGLGWSGMAMTLAMAIGPMIGLWITDNLSYESLFLIAVALAVIALFFTFGTNLPFKPKKVGGQFELFEKKVLPPMITVFLLFIAYGGITTFIPLFAESIHVNSGNFFLVYASTLIFIRPLAGKLSDKYGETFVIVPALLITIIALIILSFSSGLEGFLISAVLYGIGFGSAQSSLQAATISLVSPDRTGVANASFTTATDLGIGLGAIVLGWVSQYSSYQVLFTFSAGSVLVSLFIFIFFGRSLLSNRVSAELLEHQNDAL